jgi:hypothetical protein
MRRHVAVAVGMFKPAMNIESDLGRYVRLPRSKFEQDLPYSFRGIKAVCQLNNNEAEARIKAFAGSNGSA